MYVVEAWKEVDRIRIRFHNKILRLRKFAVYLINVELGTDNRAVNAMSLTVKYSNIWFEILFRNKNKQASVMIQLPLKFNVFSWT